ncbi:hypothetical protein GCM10009105_10320 [Dokdonella soli]|uniref:Uncharacterized protein n=1 Tax=Dokdonella soli TaxID=529810 RepID=A0ABN1IDY7_9GAMM
MFAQWVNSSTELPQEGQPVQFILDGREATMDGAYVQRAFRSHWTVYEVGRVRSWRRLLGFDSRDTSPLSAPALESTG